MPSSSGAATSGRATFHGPSSVPPSGRDAPARAAAPLPRVVPEPGRPAATGQAVSPTALAALVVAGLAGFVYLWRLDRPGLLPDELVYLVAGDELLDGGPVPNPEHPPLGKLLFGLAQRAAGGELLAGRLVAAACGLLLTACLFVLGRRLGGLRGGVACALLWLAVPHAVRSGPDGYAVPLLDRFAMLDVVATALALAALTLAFRWRDRPAWGTALGTGALLGAATAAKLPGALVAPALVVLAVAGLRASAHRGRAAGQLGVGALAAVVAVLLPFLATGRDRLDALLAPVQGQLAHLDGGHRVLVAGEVYQRTPWWTHLWYAWDNDGPLVTAALGVAVVAGVAALALARRAVDLAAVAVAVVVPLVVLSASAVALPFYRFTWLPGLVLLAGLGIAAAAPGGRLWPTGHLRAAAVGRAALAVPALVAALVLGTVGALTLGRLVVLPPSGYAAVAPLVEEAAAAGETPLVVMRGYPELLEAYVPDVRILPDVPLTGTDLVVLDPASTRRFPAADVRDAARVRGLRPVDVGGLEVWLPRAQAAALAPGS